MKRLMFSVAALVLGVAVAGPVEAGPGGNGRSGSPGSGHLTSTGVHGTMGSATRMHERSSPYYQLHAKKFGSGYFYPGKQHTHWSYRCWDKRYGCYVYYDPSLCCYYYYCVPDECYYPVSYCPHRRYCWETPVSYPTPGPAPAAATAVAVATASAGTNAVPPPPPAPLIGK